MAQTAWPLTATPATVARWARMARAFAASAIIGTRIENAYTATVAGLTLTIGRGTTGSAEAWVSAFYHLLDAADYVLAVPANTNPTLARMDRLVLRMDLGAETLALTHLPGTPAASPAAVTLTQTATVWDFPLWRFTVPANSGAPLASLIDDRVFYDPATGAGATTYSYNAAIVTAQIGGPQAAALTSPILAPGAYEAEIVGRANANTGTAQGYLVGANGLTFATGASGDPTATASGQLEGTFYNSTTLGNTAIRSSAAPASTTAYAPVNLADTVGAYLPFRLRAAVRVLTAGSLQLNILNSNAAQPAFLAGGSVLRTTFLGA